MGTVSSMIRFKLSNIKKGIKKTMKICLFPNNQKPFPILQLPLTNNHFQFSNYQKTFTN